MTHSLSGHVYIGKVPAKSGVLVEARELNTTTKIVSNTVATSARTNAGGWYELTGLDDAKHYSVAVKSTPPHNYSTYADVQFHSIVVDSTVSVASNCVVTGDVRALGGVAAGLNTASPDSGQFWSIVATVASIAQRVTVSGESYDRFTVDGQGVLLWGAGTGVGDVNLYRGGANTLKTNANILAASNLDVSGTATVTGNATFKGTVGVSGALSVTSSFSLRALEQHKPVIFVSTSTTAWTTVATISPGIYTSVFVEFRGGALQQAVGTQKAWLMYEITREGAGASATNRSSPLTNTYFQIVASGNDGLVQYKSDGTNAIAGSGVVVAGGGGNSAWTLT